MWDWTGQLRYFRGETRRNNFFKRAFRFHAIRNVFHRRVLRSAVPKFVRREPPSLSPIIYIYIRHEFIRIREGGGESGN